jgi:membrane dipeptidase
VLIWDQHACLPLGRGAKVDALYDYLEAGVGFVSVNVGFDLTAPLENFHVLAGFRRQIGADPERLLAAETAADVREAQRSERLAVAFDLEGAEALDGDAAMVELYHHLGVRTMLIAYNGANRAGGGCHGDPEQGLTEFGREVVAEMNRVGMMVDATHCSLRTTMDLFEVSTAPVVFSHSVPAAVFGHERNVTDGQMKACAATGGVVGINGVGLFLGEPRATSEAVFRALDHAVDVIGPDHVGLGLDFVADPQELDDWVRQNAGTFPAGGGYGTGMRIAGPDQIAEVIGLMRDAGYADDAVRAIAGENFLRVATEVWG